MPNIKLATGNRVPRRKKAITFANGCKTLNRRFDNGNIAAMVFKGYERTHYRYDIKWMPDNGEFESFVNDGLKSVVYYANSEFNFEVDYSITKKVARLDFRQYSEIKKLPDLDPSVSPGRPIYEFEILVQIESLTPFTECDLQELYDKFYDWFDDMTFEYVVADSFGQPWFILKNDVCTHPNKTSSELSTMQHNGSSVPCRVYVCDDCGEEFFKPLTLLRV